MITPADAGVFSSKIIGRSRPGVETIPPSRVATLTVFINPRRTPLSRYPEAFRGILSLAAHENARASIENWDGYEVTPLIRADDLAVGMGLAALWIKDESQRFGLGSFKALGGAYGVARVVAEAGVPPANITVACASDGNHGRAVAWGANRAGCRARVYLPSHVSRSRGEAIEAWGARVIRVEGEYDEAVAQAAADARSLGLTVVTDTAYSGEEEIPRTVMQGYTVMVEEALEQIGADRPTHVFVQGGVGGLAASVIAHVWERVGPPLPTVVVVEPEAADCLLASARQGRPTPSAGSLSTVMAGLSCRHVSTLAWPILERGVHGFMTVPDSAVFPTMRALASGLAGTPVEGGESGVVGLVGLQVAASDPDLRSALGLNEGSRTLVFNTEGATDPGLYRQVIEEDRGPCPTSQVG